MILNCSENKKKNTFEGTSTGISTLISNALNSAGSDIAPVNFPGTYRTGNIQGPLLYSIEHVAHLIVRKSKKSGAFRIGCKSHTRFLWTFGMRIVTTFRRGFQGRNVFETDSEIRHQCSKSIKPVRLPPDFQPRFRARLTSMKMNSKLGSSNAQHVTYSPAHPRAEVNHLLASDVH